MRCPSSTHLLKAWSNKRTFIKKIWCLFYTIWSSSSAYQWNGLCEHSISFWGWRFHIWKTRYPCFIWLLWQSTLTHFSMDFCCLLSCRFVFYSFNMSSWQKCCSCCPFHCDSVISKDLLLTFLHHITRLQLSCGVTDSKTCAAGSWWIHLPNLISLSAFVDTGSLLPPWLPLIAILSCTTPVTSLTQHR